jgi:hypothetical protein
MTIQTRPYSNRRNNTPNLPAQQALNSIVADLLALGLPESSWSPDIEKLVDDVLNCLSTSSEVTVNTTFVKRPLVIIRPDEGGMAIYARPKGRGGDKSPECLLELTPTHTRHLKAMNWCRRLDDRFPHVCKHCILCRAKAKYRRLFDNIYKSLRSVDKCLVSLDEYRKKGRSFADFKTEVLGLATTSQALWWANTYRKYRRSQSRIKDNLEARLKCGRWRTLRPRARLIRLPHYWMSLSFPKELAVLFDFHEDWFKSKVPDCPKEAQPHLRDSIDLFRKKRPKASVRECLRDAFKRLTLQAVDKMWSDVVPSYLARIHPFSTTHSAPDVHVLACSVAVTSGSHIKGFGWTESAVDFILLDFDEDAMRAAYVEALKKFSDVVAWCLRNWAVANRSRPLIRWKQQVRSGIDDVRQGRIDDSISHVEVVGDNDSDSKGLLSVYQYMESDHLGDIVGLKLDPKSESMKVQFNTAGKKKYATMTVWELLRRFVGESGRQYSLRATGRGIYNPKLVPTADRRTAISTYAQQYNQSVLKSLRNHFRMTRNMV